ncbi:MAG: HNH endonuclease [Anaerolineales bacterium]|nr:HNH endonuclease [Anaerolineales bacterium]
MAFPESVVREAWTRSGDRCECRRTRHSWHSGRCSQHLGWDDRGKEKSTGWEAHHVAAGGPDTLSNCEILCQRCHKATLTYGG